MLDLAIVVGAFDDPAMTAERERLVRAIRRADRSMALAWGAFCGALLFVCVVGWIA